jgi:hypothetical protein
LTGAGEEPFVFEASNPILYPVYKSRATLEVFTAAVLTVLRQEKTMLRHIHGNTFAIIPPRPPPPAPPGTPFRELRETVRLLRDILRVLLSYNFRRDDQCRDDSRVSEFSAHTAPGLGDGASITERDPVLRRAVDAFITSRTKAKPSGSRRS